MPIATLSSLKKKEEASGGGGGGGGGSDNSYYNGGAGRQGGSSTNQFAPPDPNDPFAQIVNQARGGAAGGGGGGSSRGEGEAGREGAKQLKVCSRTKMLLLLAAPRLTTLTADSSRCTRMGLVSETMATFAPSPIPRTRSFSMRCIR